MTPRGSLTRYSFVWAVALLAGGAGCFHTGSTPALPVPKELNKVNHPAYTIEPPDILEIDTLQTIPLPPYRVRALDVIGVKVAGAFPTDPIAGPYAVEPEGTVNLGLKYGPPISVVGLTLPEARAAIEKQLAPIIKDNATEVVLIETRAAQQIRGRHLVRSDGTVSLGEYGSVNVTGLTIPAAKGAIEAHLSQFLKDPQVTLDVLAFNSKVYYVVLDSGGAGQTVVRLPITGNETVIDAISNVSGLSAVSDAHRIWVSRPGPDGCSSVLPVDWQAVTECGDPATNYQLLPGDRLFVKAYPAVRLDNTMARVIAPIERLFGVSLLGTSLYSQIQRSQGRGIGRGTGSGTVTPVITVP
jgi:polysaccharide export outer membrane protein